jgi:poly(glycerol-phosphate) alpha-glucosyltransferase
MVLFERASLQNAACLHALGEAELRSIRDLGLRNPVAVIPNGVTMNSRLSTGSKGRKTMLFLGRIHPKKGHRELVEAWQILRQSSENYGAWRLVIAGWDDGGHEAELRRTCRNLALGDAVAFVGPLFEREKERALVEADAFILPSKSEGLPMSVLEAWSYGLPVLMTQECNLDSAFQTRAAFPVSTIPAEMAKDICKFMKLSDSERGQLADSGRSLVSASYGWASIADRVIALHRWVIGEEDTPCFVDVLN